MPRHEVERDLAYPPEPLFDIAADVERYPEFLPGWIAARVVARAGNVYQTEQVLGLGTFRLAFRSQTVLWRPERIVVTSTDRAVKAFHMEWAFACLPGRSCRVTARVRVELSSGLAQALFERMIAHSIGSIMAAFEERAQRVLGA